MNTSTQHTEIQHVELEAALRRELRARTGPLVAHEVPFARLEAAARRDRIRRRVLTGTGLVLAAALLAASPAAVGALKGRGAVATNGSGSARVATSLLFAMAPRGNLVKDTAFMHAVIGKFSAGATILYANDDGTHTVVIAGSDGGIFSTLVGPHNAQVSELKRDIVGEGGSSVTPAGYTYVGELTGSGKTVPYVVLGPANMTKAEYATGVKLVDQGGKITSARTGVTSVPLTDGAGAGELRDPTDIESATRLSLLLSWTGSTSSGGSVDLGPSLRSAEVADVVTDIFNQQYQAIRQAVVHQAAQDGITVDAKGPGGDEVTDNAAQVLSDFALAAGVDPASVTFTVEWVGRETSQWDSALIEFDAPGQPAIQAFVRGLAPGQPDSESPGLAKTYVRPAVPFGTGQDPKTAAQFGGTTEASTFGYLLQQRW